MVGIELWCAVLFANFGIGVVLELLTGAALVANFGGGFVLELLVDLELLIGAALIANLGRRFVLELLVGNFVGSWFAGSLPGPLVGVGLRTEVWELNAEVVRTEVWELNAEDFVGSGAAPGLLIPSILPALSLLLSQVAAMMTRIGLVVDREVY